MTALLRQLNRSGHLFQMPNICDLKSWTYQPAAGKPNLTSLLEKKYGARVVICNGAKHALAAAFFSLKRAGCNTIYYDAPYYPANPSLTESVGLSWRDPRQADSFLITSPNNPDGRNYSNTELINWFYKGPMIHDAAYYTDIYLPDDQMVLPLGHIQIHSMSKSYGLSGLRIGYAVCHDEKYYKDVVDFVETTTAGVSTASQDIAHNIEAFFIDRPECYRAFISEARTAIALSRKELERIDPDVLELVSCQSNSMFGWFKAGPALDYNAAKVYILPGELFGQPGMMRMNIAYPVEVIREAVDRLNEHKIRS